MPVVATRSQRAARGNQRRTIERSGMLLWCRELRSAATRRNLVVPMAIKPRILIVEDEENLRLALEDNLIDEGYRVSTAANGREAMKCYLAERPDLIVLDIMLPDTDGYTLCRTLRDKGAVLPVLMLTARTLESDLVQGFDAGADDYLAKPYRLRELLARVKALLRRRINEETDKNRPTQYRFGRYLLDLTARTVSDEQRTEVNLTRTEFDLLACLLESCGRALSREDILAQAWDPDVVIDPRTVDNFVSNVKKKLGWKESDNYRIRTVRGVGYRMEMD